jgi:hypothetical protein
MINEEEELIMNRSSRNFLQSRRLEHRDRRFEQSKNKVFRETNSEWPSFSSFTIINIQTERSDV